jgi:hypothetical protein
VVGAEKALLVDGEALEVRIRALMREGARDPWLESSSRLMDLHAGRWSVREGLPRNTDEHPLLEFSAPISERDGSIMVGDRLRAYFEITLAKAPPTGLLARAAPGQSLSTRAERAELVRRRLAGPAEDSGPRQAPTPLVATDEETVLEEQPESRGR